MILLCSEQPVLLTALVSPTPLRFRLAGLLLKQTSKLIIWAPSVFSRTPEEGEISCQTFNCFLKRLYYWRVAPSAHVVQYTWCKRRLQTTWLYRLSYTNWNPPYILLHECLNCDLWLVSQISTCSSVLFQILANKIQNWPLVSVDAAHRLNEPYRKLGVGLGLHCPSTDLSASVGC